MGKKRKRPSSEGAACSRAKSSKVEPERAMRGTTLHHALLNHYFCSVLSLRQFLLCKLPSESKARRRKILLIPEARSQRQPAAADASAHGIQTLSALLDSTLIGVERSACSIDRRKKWASFSQQLDLSKSTMTSHHSANELDYGELVDFCIWQLFSEGRRGKFMAGHLLCQGFQSSASHRNIQKLVNPVCSIPGLVQVQENVYVTRMKTEPWPRLLQLLGHDAEHIVMDLLLDCAIFVAVETGQNNYLQISGTPLSDLLIREPAPGCSTEMPSLLTTGPVAVEVHAIPRATLPKRPSDIFFVRNRMLYAKAALNAAGRVRLGLGHIHILNRAKACPQGLANRGTPEYEYTRSTLVIAMYIFPRQFGLHNVFTSEVDKTRTVQPLRDYTVRSEEVSLLLDSTADTKETSRPVKVPRRLRGEAIMMISKMQKLHACLPYALLLNKYCPTPNAPRPYEEGIPPEVTASDVVRTQDLAFHLDDHVDPVPRQPRRQKLIDHATPDSQVSSFLKAVLCKLVPIAFCGVGSDRDRNMQLILRNVDRFVRLRRFETLSLQEVCENIKIRSMSWLASHNDLSSKPSQHESHKRLEVLNEFIYYIFDSIVIPLIRSNFHVTESSSDKYKLFYFRHDIWRSLTEPAINHLKMTTFEELSTETAQKTLQSRALGYSQIRLLPKGDGVRPIMNLRRRLARKKNNDRLGASINTILGPVFQMLNYERIHNPGRLGSAMFSVDDMYPRIKDFSCKSDIHDKPLYFAKVDVRAAFDTIPQAAVLRIMSAIPAHQQYQILRYVEVKATSGDQACDDQNGMSKPTRNWGSLALTAADNAGFSEKVELELANSRKDTVFVQGGAAYARYRTDLLRLLHEHVRQNIVKIGKRFYRQSTGIPQGSVLSSLLCNYFYADLERAHLNFLQADSSLLLRLIDDFLLITTDRAHAEQFLQVMHGGLPAYGVEVNLTKTLVNFEVIVNGQKINRPAGTLQFPYCANLINTRTLRISKDRSLLKNTALSNSLTIEHSRRPGLAFQRKVLDSFKIQAHAMFLDTTLNGLQTVLSSIYDTFTESAMKMWTYIRGLAARKTLHCSLIIQTITNLTKLAFVLMKSKAKNPKNATAGYKCSVTQFQVEWLAVRAFHVVLSKRQSGYAGVLAWLETRITALGARTGKEAACLHKFRS